MLHYDAATFHDITSGRRSGVGASLLRGALRIAEIGYTAAVRCRNHRYDRGAVPARRADVPVVSVGNLTLGGTGKTPMVQWIARWFRDHGVQVAIVSRGYGARDGAANDEWRELHASLPDVPHLQNPDRWSAARQAVREFQSRVIVLDDGFQHRRIARDLDIVLLDAMEPFGFGHVFPRGLLREPLEGLRRADLVILSRAELISEDARNDVWKIVDRCARTAAPRVEATHSPRSLVAIGGEEASLGVVQGRAVAAFCGIGNPAAFRRTLERCGCRVIAFREFPDHCRYSPHDIEQLDRWAASLDVDFVLCTRKDAVKLSVERLGGRPLRAVAIEINFLTGGELLESRLQSLLPL